MTIYPLKHKIVQFGVAAFLATPMVAFAEVDSMVREAMALTEKGQAQAAFSLLEKLESARAGDPDFDLMLGVSASQIGDHNRAIFAFERVISVQPGNARARAELAKSLFAVGDNAGARRLLSETKDQGVPVEVATTLDQFMQAVDRVEEAGRSSVKSYVEFGLGNDSNANGGPGNSIVAVPLFGGALVTLNPAGIKAGANFTTMGTGVSGRYVIDPRWSLIGNFNTNFRWNADPASSFNSWRNDLSAGASYREERNEYSVAAQAGSYDVGGSNARNLSGLVAEWTYRLDGFRQFGTYFQTSRLSYPGQNVRDAQRNVLGISYAHLSRSGLMGFGGLYTGSENEFAAGSPHLGHKFVGLRGGLQNPFSDTLSVFATVGYEMRDFGGPDPFFLVNRADKQTNLNIGLTWVPAKAWRVTPQIAYTRTESNVPINAYDALQVGVTVRREF